MNSFVHIVEIDKEKQLIVINRRFENGRVELYSSIDIRELKSNPLLAIFMIGENILLDTEEGRAIIDEVVSKGNYPKIEGLHENDAF
ncbi:hypothetical protein P2G88_16725 [Aliiglaciecola sp. CAU 1673]|uniref:hypothetical protein n=1 Tax=Aliiglaciecola sp. CAU 1673 TaxID=3032595 RepID=UPI0023DCD0CA|nr:hypothetical protein [Aliiglaciecola sp. CAU 1673]MDF2179899.1 hypothetical protein [Aliiglaciecola sp. CAU 1673]